MNDQFKKICYKKNYLVDVVARVDFVEPPKALNSNVLPENVQKAIKERYEIYEPNTAIVQGIQVSDKGFSTQKEEFHQWIYHGVDRDKTINLSKKNAIVTLKKYKDYDQFRLDVLNPLQTVQDTEGATYASRTGLRFINIFTDVLSSLEEVPKYFSSMISGQFAGLYEPESCSRSFLITEYLYGEVKLRMQTGIYNPDYPARIKKLEFIVDIDAYVDTPHPFANVGSIIDNLHGHIQRHFEASITNMMRGKLNGPQRRSGNNRRPARVSSKPAKPPRKPASKN